MDPFKDSFLGGYLASSLTACPATGLHQPLVACRRRRGHIKGEGSPLAGWPGPGHRSFLEGIPRRSPGVEAERSWKEEVRRAEGREPIMRRDHAVRACTCFLIGRTGAINPQMLCMRWSSLAHRTCENHRGVLGTSKVLGHGGCGDGDNQRKQLRSVRQAWVQIPAAT